MLFIESDLCIAYGNFVFLQLYAGQIILQSEHAVPVRFFAKEAAPPALKEDGELNNDSLF